MAGRGTDIQLTSEAEQAGGLHVISAERHASSRIDRQLVGRAARQGDPGSCQFFVSADDPLVRLFAPRLRDRMQRATHADGEISNDYSAEIERLQQTVEGKH